MAAGSQMRQVVCVRRRDSGSPTMASTQWLLLALCTAVSVAGNLLPGGDHQHGAALHNSVHQHGDHAKPDVPPEPLEPQRPAAQPGRLPQLYFPPSIPDGAQIAIEPTDEVSLTPLFPSSSEGGGGGGSSVPDFVQPTFGGWTPMTPTGHQSQPQPQTGNGNFGSSFSSHGQQSSGGGDAGWTQGASSTGQQSQFASQTGGGDSGSSSFVSTAPSFGSSQGLLTAGSPQTSAPHSGGGENGLLSSYVPPFSGGDGSFSQGESSVSTDLKPLNLPQTGGVSSQFSSQVGGDNAVSSSSSFVSSSSGGGGSFSQEAVSTGGSSQLSPQSGGGDISLPSSYVPPSSGGAGSFLQGGSAPTELKPLNLPQTGELSQSSFQTGGGNNGASSSSFAQPLPGGDNSFSQQGSVPTDLKPLNLPQTGESSSQFTSQTSSGDISSPSSSYVPPSSGGSDSFSQGGSAPTELKPLNLPQTGEFSQSSFQTGGGNNGASSSYFVQPVPGGEVPTDLKPLNLPQTGESSSQFTSLTGGGEISSPSSSSYVPPSSGGGNSFSQGGSAFTELKPLNLPQTGEFSQSPFQTNGGNNGASSSSFVQPLPGGDNSFSPQGPVPTDLKPLNLPQTGESSSQFISQTSGGDIGSPSSSYVPFTSGGGDSFSEEGSVPSILKPINLPQTGGFPQSPFPTNTVNSGASSPFLVESSPVGDNSLSQGLIPTELKPLNLPQTAEPPSQFTSQTGGGDISSPPSLYVPPSSGGDGSFSQEGSVPTILKPINLPRPGGFPQPSFQTEGGNIGSSPSVVESSPGGGSFFSQAESVPTDLKPLNLPQSGGFSSPSSSPTFSEDNGDYSSSLAPSSSGESNAFSQGVSSVPTILKPLNLPQTGGSSSQFASQAGSGDISLPPSYVPPSSGGGGGSFSQGEGSVPTDLKPLNLPETGGFSSQSSSQTGSQSTGSSSPSFVPVSSAGGSSFSQGETSVPTILKPIDLPPQIGEPQLISQTNGGDISGLTSSYVPPSSGGGSSFPQGGAITGGSSSFTSQQGDNGDIGTSSPSYVQPALGGNGSPSQGVGPGPSNVPTLLKPLGLPPTGGSSSQSSSQSSDENASSQSSSYVPPTQVGGGSSQVASSTLGTSPQSTAQQTGGGAAPPPWSYKPPASSGGGSSVPQLTGAPAPPPSELTGFPAPGGVPTILKPLDLPQQIAVEPEQNVVQAGFQPQDTGSFGQSVSSSAPQYVDNKPLFAPEAPAGVNKPFFPPSTPQGGSNGDFGFANSQSSPGFVDNYTPDGPTGPAPSTVGATNGGGTLPAQQTAEQVYQPEEVLGVAASGGVGSSVPFPSAPVQNKPLGLPQQSLGTGQPSTGGPTDLGPPVRPPNVVVDEQFLTGPSGGAAVGAPGIPVDSGVVSGGSSFGISSGGSSGINSGGNGGSNGGSGSGISGSGSGSSVSGSGSGSGSSGGGSGSGISSGSGSSASSGGGGSGAQAEIVSQKFTIDENGNYEYSYEQTDGQAAQETGRVTPGNEPETGTLVSTGGYRYRGDDGRQYAVQYTADERGFLPTADHLPTPPAQIPAYAELREKYPALFWAEKLRVRSPQE